MTNPSSTADAWWLSSRKLSLHTQCERMTNAVQQLCLWRGFTSACNWKSAQMGSIRLARVLLRELRDMHSENLLTYDDVMLDWAISEILSDTYSSRYINVPGTIKDKLAIGKGSRLLTTDEKQYLVGIV